ncbi:hypothetical protein V1514DRAFT_369487 [Lipomyces japonicus]|uniref:uncharacterized protein n=1 Tax=Lipomyces japonicus TaxID=56871 RepID=UPI0034CF8768
MASQEHYHDGGHHHLDQDQDHDQQQHQHGASEFGSFVDFSELQLDLSTFGYDDDATRNMLGKFESHLNHDFDAFTSQLHNSHGQQQQQQQQEQHANHDHQQHNYHHEQHQQQQKQLVQEEPPLIPGHVISAKTSTIHDGSSSSAIIPPTPNSLEFVGGNGNHANLNNNNNHNKNNNNNLINNSVFRSPSGLIDPYAIREEMMFTPLLSPAVTPLDTPMHMGKDFAYPSATYFSPLTSPALEAQPYPFPVISATSPQQADMQGAQQAAKLRRRPAGAFATPIAATSSSPSVRALSGSVTSTSKLSLSPPSQQRSSKRRAMTAVTGADVSSPEPLLALPESSMAPPPMPTFKTPIGSDIEAAIAAASAVAANAAQPIRLQPVTPATLMNLKNGHAVSKDVPSTQDADAVIETVRTRAASVVMRRNDVQLPSSSSSSSLSITSPALAPQDELAKRAIKPTLARSRSGSVVSIASPSPTIKPRASPSLRPLLPDGMESTVTALLASKSNYQNIVEGKHSQLGLTYPEQLSINLTSKRTSHKIAEQGRRNRINNALAELNQLLVANTNVAYLDDDDGTGEVECDGAGESKPDRRMDMPQQASKANTVELAIEYIKKLQVKVTKLKDRVKEVECDLEIERQKNNSQLAMEDMEMNHAAVAAAAEEEE